MMQSTSNLRIVFSARFNDKLENLPIEIVTAFDGTLDVFKENPTHKSHRRHFLKEKYQGYESINITDDYRAIFKESKSFKTTIITFYFIGTHSELYSK